MLFRTTMIVPLSKDTSVYPKDLLDKINPSAIAAIDETTVSGWIIDKKSTNTRYLFVAVHKPTVASLSDPLSDLSCYIIAAIGHNDSAVGVNVIQSQIYPEEYANACKTSEGSILDLLDLYNISDVSYTKLNIGADLPGAAAMFVNVNATGAIIDVACLVDGVAKHDHAILISDSTIDDIKIDHSGLVVPDYVLDQYLDDTDVISDNLRNQTDALGVMAPQEYNEEEFNEDLFCNGFVYALSKTDEDEIRAICAKNNYRYIDISDKSNNGHVSVNVSAYVKNGDKMSFKGAIIELKQADKVLDACTAFGASDINIVSCTEGIKPQLIPFLKHKGSLLTDSDTMGCCPTDYVIVYNVGVKIGICQIYKLKNGKWGCVGRHVNTIKEYDRIDFYGEIEKPLLDVGEIFDVFHQVDSSVIDNIQEARQLISGMVEKYIGKFNQ